MLNSYGLQIDRLYWICNIIFYKKSKKCRKTRHIKEYPHLLTCTKWLIRYIRYNSVKIRQSCLIYSYVCKIILYSLRNIRIHNNRFIQIKIRTWKPLPYFKSKTFSLIRFGDDKWPFDHKNSTPKCWYLYQTLYYDHYDCNCFRHWRSCVELKSIVEYIILQHQNSEIKNNRNF